jgi:hypothetical protein
MRLTVAVVTLALVSGCGGSSAGQLLVDPARGTPSAQPPVVSASVPAPVRTAKPPPDVVVTPEPAGVVSPEPTAAYAGTATSGPARRVSPEASPSPRPTPSAVAGTVTVNQDDSGSTVHLAPGQHLRVRLTSGTWDAPVSSAERVVVRRSSTGGYPSDQPVDAVFEAVGHGSADVTAQSDAACFHTEPRCMMASRQWEVHVVVS